MGQALRDSNKADLEKRLLEEQVSDSKAGTSLPEPIGPGRPRWGFCWKVDHLMSLMGFVGYNRLCCFC